MLLLVTDPKVGFNGFLVSRDVTLLISDIEVGIDALFVGRCIALLDLPLLAAYHTLGLAFLLSTGAATALSARNAARAARRTQV
jgi:hypothetical protein